LGGAGGNGTDETQGTNGTDGTDPAGSSSPGGAQDGSPLRELWVWNERQTSPGGATELLTTTPLVKRGSHSPNGAPYENPGQSGAAPWEPTATSATSPERANEPWRSPRQPNKSHTPAPPSDVCRRSRTLGHRLLNLCVPSDKSLDTVSIRGYSDTVFQPRENVLGLRYGIRFLDTSRRRRPRRWAKSSGEGVVRSVRAAEGPDSSLDWMNMCIVMHGSRHPRRWRGRLDE